MSIVSANLDFKKIYKLSEYLEDELSVEFELNIKNNKHETINKIISSKNVHRIPHSFTRNILTLFLNSTIELYDDRHTSCCSPSNPNPKTEEQREIAGIELERLDGIIDDLEEFLNG